MRIDVGITGYRPDYNNRQNQSGDVYELNSKGENLKGRIIDVNQNIVLIQTATGRQFSATTTIPMENFINQEMDFLIIVGQDGEIILNPDIDEKNKNSLMDLKIEDILGKLSKQANSENKDIIKEMIKASIPITKENFEEIKELKFSINLLKTEDFKVKLENSDENKNINELLKELQNRKDFGIAQKSDTAVLDKNIDLKNILLLKNLDMKSSVQNIKSLYNLIESINSNKEDILGIKSLLKNENFNQKLNMDIENVNKSLSLSLLDSNMGNVSNDENLLMEIAEDLSFEDMERLNKGLKDLVFEDFYDNEKLGQKIQSNKEDMFSEMKITAEDIMDIIKNIEKNISKKLQVNSNNRKQDLSIDYDKVKDYIKSIINILGKESEIAKIIEKQISPKLEIMSNMNERYNYNLIPFKIDENYENTLQYYVKKGKKSIKKQDDINIGLSLDTKRYKNIKTMINYNKDKRIKLNFYMEDKNVKNIFETNSSKLKDALNLIGFSGIDINFTVNSEKKSNMINEVLYENDKLEIFEMWI